MATTASPIAAARAGKHFWGEKPLGRFPAETAEIAAAVETPTATAGSFLGYALIGFLVGIVPVAFGLAWLPSLRRADPRWLAAFMALTTVGPSALPA